MTSNAFRAGKRAPNIVFEVPDVSQIAGLTGDYDGQQISLAGWLPNTITGGGSFIWNASRAKSDHDGCTVFSPTVPYNSDTIQYLLGNGETDSGGSGCWERITNGYITPQMCGAIGDGVTNETQTMRQVFIVAGDNNLSVRLTNLHFINTTVKIPANVDVDGIGIDSGFVCGVSGVAGINIIGDNVSLNNFKIKGFAAGGVQVRAEADAFIVKNTKIKNIHFEGDSTSSFVNQCVWLYGSSNTLVSGCIFNTTGYGVISQYGYTANDVLVTSNTFQNLLRDAVLANSGGPVVSRRWTITDNQYLGHANYPFAGIEGRFVGTASTDDVIVANNNVINSGGDAAVHIETTGGRTIVANNIFKDCYGTAGNIGWVYLLDSIKDCSVIGNTFIYEANVGAQVGISVSSGSYFHTASWSNNTFLDLSGTQQFTAISAKTIQSDSAITISGNVANDIAYFADCNNATSLNITGNTVKGALKGVWNNAGSTGGGINNTLITSNLFECSEHALLISYNSSGTGRCSAVLCSDNILNGPVIFNYTDDSHFRGNIVGSGHSVSRVGGVRLIDANNSQVGVGAI